MHVELVWPPHYPLFKYMQCFTYGSMPLDENNSTECRMLILTSKRPISGQRWRKRCKGANAEVSKCKCRCKGLKYWRNRFSMFWRGPQSIALSDRFAVDIFGNSRSVWIVWFYSHVSASAFGYFSKALKLMYNFPTLTSFVVCVAT